MKGAAREGGMGCGGPRRRERTEGGCCALGLLP